MVQARRRLTMERRVKLLADSNRMSGRNPDIAYFRLPSHPSWELTAVYKKGSYQMKAAKDFIQLAEEYWNQHPYLTEEP